ncbi:1-aminocyclopropane-1-carboxylate oxidase [Acorus calamus]|uniref:1-aminocyclopropane-1-carboxylate oxidase n=1 Tax=Acorus calamus TaxID=4465 RepID=A0AAV9DJ74_ACOCL|nr:1-aminocyclopropane-1-carboxylate oxidase [Acorus calamus]
MAIPVIDFSKLDGDSKTKAEALAEIANGCEEWGFFQLVNHGIPLELLEQVKKVCSESYKEREQDFKRSEPVRLLNRLIDGNDGLSAENLKKCDWEDVFILHDDNEWPSSPLNFKETMKEYRTELKKLAEKVMEAMDTNLGLQKGYIKKSFSNDDDDNDEPFFGTKVSHYPPCPRPDLVTGLRAHTDAGGVILLYQDDEVGGLQILKNGRWIDVQPVKDAIVINTGDQIEVISNGRYKSVWHRVLAMKDGNRRSIASFYNPSYKATIAPAPELSGAEGYPAFVFGNYMSVYAKQKFMPKEPRFQAVKAL